MQQYLFIFSNERRYRIQRHLAFWLFWWLSQAYLYSFTPRFVPTSFGFRLMQSTIESLIYLGPHIFLSYALIYFVIPRYLLKNKYTLTAIWVAMLFFITAAFSAVLSLTIIYDVRKRFSPDTAFFTFSGSYAKSFFNALLAGLRGGITVGGLAAAIKIMKHWYVKEQRNLQLQKQNAESQLELLKAQIHPHFLFNTLNNIYSFTQDTSPAASKLVLGLSDILRYMLYEGNQLFVPLSKEIKMIGEFIALEKIRYGNKLDLHIDVPENGKDLVIAPLLLLPFIENCFKHGTSTMLEQPWLNLQITIAENVMTMKLLNGKSPGKANSEAKPGIGINNARKRLELIYPGKHELSLINDTDVFIVALKLELEKKQGQSEVIQRPKAVLNA